MEAMRSAEGKKPAESKPFAEGVKPAESRSSKERKADEPITFNAHPLDLEPGTIIPPRPSINLSYNDFTRESMTIGESRSFVPKKRDPIPFELSEIPRKYSESRENKENRDARDIRDTRDARDSADARDSRGNGDARDNRHAGPGKQSKSTDAPTAAGQRKPQSHIQGLSKHDQPKSNDRNIESGGSNKPAHNRVVNTSQNQNASRSQNRNTSKDQTLNAGRSQNRNADREQSRSPKGRPQHPGAGGASEVDNQDGASKASLIRPYWIKK
jgi:hypothetical protein